MIEKKGGRRARGGCLVGRGEGAKENEQQRGSVTQRGAYAAQRSGMRRA